MTDLDNRPAPTTAKGVPAWWETHTTDTVDVSPIEEFGAIIEAAYTATVELLATHFGSGATSAVVAAPIDELYRLEKVDLTTFAHAFDGLWEEAEDSPGERRLRPEYEALADLGLVRLAGERLTAYLVAVSPSALAAFLAWCQEEGFTPVLQRAAYCAPPAAMLMAA